MTSRDVLRLSLADQVAAAQAFVDALGDVPTPAGLETDTLARSMLPTGKAADFYSDLRLARIPDTPYVYWAARVPAGRFVMVGEFMHIIGDEEQDDAHP